jgi:TRAP-type C4-dicarboxylate transport system permease small subunit
MRHLLDRVSAGVARVTAGVVATAALVMIAALLIQVFFRYVLGASLSWPGELAQLLFAWTMLLAASIGVRDGFHVRLELLRGLLPEGLRAALERVTLVLLAGFGLVLVVTGADYVEQTLGQLSAAMRYPIELLHAAAPVTGALVALHALARLFWRNPDAGPATSDQAEDVP